MSRNPNFMRNSHLIFFAFLFEVCFAVGCENNGSEQYAKETSQADSETTGQNPDVVVETEYGEIGILLYDDTPKHKASFLKLVNDGYFNGKTFFRVIQNILIQAGGPPLEEQKYEPSDNYIEPEISSKRFHKRGAVAAGRLPDERNPERLSTATHFYIVTGSVFEQEMLDSLEKDVNLVQKNRAALQLANQPGFEWISDPRTAQLKETEPQKYDSLNQAIRQAIEDSANFSYTPEQRAAYSTIGGAPSFDGQYTVFGEVVYGLEVAEKISRLEVEPGTNFPAFPPKIQVKVVSGELDAE